MPLVLSSLPPSSSNPPENSRPNMQRNPLRPVLATIEPSPAMRKPALAEKRVPTPLSKPQPMEIVEEKPRFPSVTVDVESISDVMAARLVTCLLGHVLFLKSQVPFPVAQLMKMTSSQMSDEPRNKRLDKLLATFDVLSSHLGSTFTALASALGATSISASGVTRLEKAHLAIVLGPTATAINAARARVVLEVDGLCVVPPPPLSGIPSGKHVVHQNDHLEENKGAIRSAYVSKGAGPLCDASSQIPPANISCNTSDEEHLNSSIVDAPPDSDCESDIAPFDSDSEPEYDSDSESGADASEDDAHAETEVDLREAERLLSRTLAISNADPELGMAADIRPTQTHILLRAPRRFSHPSWVPRQDMGRDMDPLLNQFAECHAAREQLTDAFQDVTNSSKQGRGRSPLCSTAKRVDVKRKCLGGIKTDYVRVRSRGAEEVQGLYDGTEDGLNRDDGTEANEDNDDDDSHHEDEMIWWSWDGKLEGFTDI